MRWRCTPTRLANGPRRGRRRIRRAAWAAASTTRPRPADAPGTVGATSVATRCHVGATAVATNGRGAVATDVAPTSGSRPAWRAEAALQRLRGFDDLVDGEAEVREQLFRGRAGAEAVDADHRAIE